MKIGNFEIEEFILYTLLIVLLLICIVVCSCSVDKEKEKTKQLQLQENILMLQQGEIINEV